jgi:hypothetical protein
LQLNLDFFIQMFQQESKAEVAANREKARQPFKSLVDQKDFELDVRSFYPETTDFPKRPEWDENM